METDMLSRRGFLGTAALVGASAVSGRVQAASIPEAPIMDKATMQPPLHPTSGPDYRPVVTLNGWSLPWRMNGDWKEFHLVAEPVVRELADGMKAYLWGYNGQAPGPTIEAVEGGIVAQRHTAVVGRIDRPTPILDSKIQQINFNPYWHVPKSLIEKDLIKYMNDDPQYLTKFKIHIYDSKGNELQPTDIDWHTDEAVNYMFRQEPGAENSMGHCKINFPNKFDVYLHDTPSKSLFAENARFHSSGCVRVEGVDELVSWLLGPNGGWDETSVEAVFNSNERLDVNLKQPTPIHTTYVSAWANRNGIVSFRDDVYQFDSQGLINTTTA